MAMASSLVKRVLCILMLVSLDCLSDGAVYKVGESDGWTNNFNYQQWTVDKTFQVGDIIVFEYNPKFHNVIQVRHAEYQACNVSSPISTHTTGNDSIMIANHGHHFYVCGLPEHCHDGQRVDINVPRAPSVAPSPSSDKALAPSPSSGLLSSPVNTTVAVPAPSPSGAPTRVFEKVGWVLLLLQLLNVFGFA